MSAYANPCIQPDMSNYYRLLREQRLRARITQQYPDFPQRLETLFSMPAISSFLQAIPQKNINPHEDFGHAVQPGVVPRGIEISNSITERKIMIKRLAEATLNPEPVAEHTAEIEKDMLEFTAYLGLSEDLANGAIIETRGAMTRLKRMTTFRVIRPQP